MSDKMTAVTNGNNSSSNGSDAAANGSSSKHSSDQVTVIESRAVRFLLTKLRDKSTKGKVSQPKKKQLQKSRNGNGNTLKSR